MTSKVRTRDFREKKRRGEKIAMLTAYDANMARLLDKAGVDALLVGDSVGMVMLGYDNTVSVTLDAMIHHTPRSFAATSARWSSRTCRFSPTRRHLPMRCATPDA